jgi:hypothetical protein
MGIKAWQESTRKSTPPIECFGIERIYLRGDGCWQSGLFPQWYPISQRGQAQEHAGTSNIFLGFFGLGVGRDMVSLTLRS